MRKLMIILLILTLLVLPARAAGADSSALEGIPDSAKAYMPEDNENLLVGILNMLRKALTAVVPELRDALAACVGVLAAVILCSLFQTGEGGVQAPAADLVGTVAIATILLQPSTSLVQQGIETLQAISDYGKLLLPVMTSAMAASGGVTTASALYLGTAFFDSVLTGTMSGLLQPAVNLFLALAIAAAAIGNNLLTRFRDFLKTLITWGLKGVLYLFTGYMALTGVISGTADAAAVKVAKMAISGAVPVVGGMLSEATEAVLVGAGTVRSTAGLVGLLAVLAITAEPFIRLGLQYLLLKLTSALCGVVGNPNHTALTESFAQAMGLILAMTGTGCLIQLISTICFMKGVS